MKPWNHKFPGLPSHKFTHRQLRKYRNKRFEFVLLAGGIHRTITSRPYLAKEDGTKVKLSNLRPIKVNGIYTHLFKKGNFRSSGFSGWIADPYESPHKPSFEFIFRDVIFEQDGEFYMFPFNAYYKNFKYRSANKTRPWSFWLEEIGSCPLVNSLRTMDIIRNMELQVVM